MSVSNLTNTKWIINSSPNLDLNYYEINFISNGNLYNFICDNDQPYRLSYGITEFVPYPVYNSRTNQWDNQAYRIIEITGGTDVTNSDLITWLEANATQVPVVDLSGTSWVFNSTIEYDGSFPTYTINYKAYYNNGANYDTGTSLYMIHEASGGFQQRGPEPEPPEPGYNFFGLCGYGLTTNFSGVFFSSCIYEGSTTTMSPTSMVEELDYIEITGGTDIANPDLIAWLTNNATYQEPIVDLTGYTWTCNRIQCSAGYGLFNINYTYNGEEWSQYPVTQQLCVGYKARERGFPQPVEQINSLLMFDTQPTTGYVSIGDYLTFTGGTDATNPDLIAWLQANGTLTAPTPPGPTPSDDGSISFGNFDFSKVILGNLADVDKIFLGSVKVYEKETPVSPQLDAPVISLSENTLTIEEVENAEYYDIYVDGVLEETIDNTPTITVDITGIGNTGGDEIEISYGTFDPLTYDYTKEQVLATYNNGAFPTSVVSFQNIPKNKAVCISCDIKQSPNAGFSNLVNCQDGGNSTFNYWLYNFTGNASATMTFDED